MFNRALIMKIYELKSWRLNFSDLSHPGWLIRMYYFFLLTGIYKYKYKYAFEKKLVYPYGFNRPNSVSSFLIHKFHN